MLKTFRKISWIKTAAKDFKKFLQGARDKIEDALTITAQGEKSNLDKPMKSLGAGVFEIALKYRKDAYRAVYVLQIEKELWVVHAFKKKSKSGIKTPKQDIDLIKARINVLKEKNK